MPSQSGSQQAFVYINTSGIYYTDGSVVAICIHFLYPHIPFSQQLLQMFGGHAIIWLTTFRTIDAIQAHPNLRVIIHEKCKRIPVGYTHYLSGQNVYLATHCEQ